jgi:hypothetical protein
VAGKGNGWATGVLMVWESWYWKQRLKLLADEIELISEQDDASTLDISNLEISIFSGFFLIRKLIEAQTKLSFRTENQNIKCRVSGKIPDTPRVDLMSRFDWHELYDLNAFKPKNVVLKQLCNIFMHSIFLWMVYGEETSDEQQSVVTGVHVTSDYEKEKQVYWVEISEILRVFRSVIMDYQDVLSMQRDPVTNEMKVKRS